MFHLEGIDPEKDIWPWGGEPLFRDNEFVGTVTSAGLVEIYSCIITHVLRVFFSVLNIVIAFRHIK